MHNDYRETPYSFALKELGVSEIATVGYHNLRIVSYHSTTTLKATNDETPWCSSFVNWCVIKAGLTGTNSAAAISWMEWGKPTDNPKVGDIVIVRRGINSYHVGFFVEKKPGIIVILGGNQKDSVCFSNFLDQGIVGYRSVDLPTLPNIA